jgi:hypothetical protein
VGLPHRNRSLFKQAHINKQKRIKDKPSHGMTRNQISSGGGWKASERSERALFPEGRGLGVGRNKVKERKVKRKSKKESKRPSKSKTELHLMRGGRLACMNEHPTPL